MPLETVVLTVPASGVVRSNPVGPRVGYSWSVVEYTAVAPPGTNGALLLYQGGQLRKVLEIGEYTSDAFTPPIYIPQGDSLAIESQGVPPGTLTVNLVY